MYESTDQGMIVKRPSATDICGADRRVAAELLPGRRLMALVQSVYRGTNHRPTCNGNDRHCDTLHTPGEVAAGDLRPLQLHGGEAPDVLIQVDEIL